jgi:hypothetical protein
MRKGTSVEYTVQKMLFCFAKIIPEILLLILGYSMFAGHHILVQFSQMLLP